MGNAISLWIIGKSILSTSGSVAYKASNKADLQFFSFEQVGSQYAIQIPTLLTEPPKSKFKNSEQKNGKCDLYFKIRVMVAIVWGYY